MAGHSNSREITSLDAAQQRGLVCHLPSTTKSVGNDQQSMTSSVKTWMIYSDMIFHSTCRSTWLSSGERIIINKHKKDARIALADNLHGNTGDAFSKCMDSFAESDILAASKCVISYEPGTLSVLLSTHWSLCNLYHLIFDSLAKLSIAEKVCDKERIRVLAPDGWLLPELLDLLGYKYRLFKRNEFIQSRAGILSMPHFIGNIPIDSRLYLAKASLHIEPGLTNAIYISREPGSKRSILNEDELMVRLLSIVHIDVVRLEHLSIMDQVVIMKGVSLVVAPHGAGLSWLGFNTKICHIFEIFSSDYINHCFNGVSDPGAIHYQYVESNTSQAGGFLVDIPKILEELSYFLEIIKKR